MRPLCPGSTALPFVNREVNGRCAPGHCYPTRPWLIVEKSGRDALGRSWTTCDDLGRMTMTDQTRTLTLVLGGTGKTGRLFSTVLDGRNAHLCDGIPQVLGRPARDFADYARDAAGTGIWNQV